MLGTGIIFTFSVGHRSLSFINFINKYFTKKNAHILLAIATISFFSCNAGNRGKTASSAKDSVGSAGRAVSTPGYDTSLIKGKVTDSITCRKDGRQYYALYLPSNYNPADPYPCIFFFDAHARGGMPVRAYKNIAEKYGCVLAASDNSKNGTPWPETNALANTMMQDVRTRININPRRVYTAGFSGGSRVASSIAILDGGVAGVMGCAAGFPSLEKGLQDKFDYFGIVGDFDFNETEMAQLDAMLEQNGFAHQLLTTGNIHGWPAPADFETGLLWMQVNGMKEQLQPANDAVIAAFKKDFDTRIAAARASGEWIRAYDLLAGVIRALDGLADVSLYKKQIADLGGSANYRSAMAMQAKLQPEEMGQQQELRRQFEGMDEKWWGEKIALLNGSIKNAKTLQESQMYRRLLNYLGLLGYMYSDHALRTSDLTNAETYLKIFKMADPKNPDCSYLAAVYYMEKGNQPQAITALNEAAALGYSEVSKLMTDPAFGSMYNDPAFMDVVHKVADNYASK